MPHFQVSFFLPVMVNEISANNKVQGITLFNVETWGVVAQSPEPGARVKNAPPKKEEEANLGAHY